jgi:hypothetical protein
MGRLLQLAALSIVQLVDIEFRFPLTPIPPPVPSVQPVQLTDPLVNPL